MTPKLSSMAKILACVWLWPLAAGATGITPCGGVDLAWQCVDGTAQLMAQRGARDDGATGYHLLSGGAVARLGRGSASVPVADSGPITIAGMSKDSGLCCLSSRSVPSDKPDCAPVPEPDGTPTAPRSEPPTPPDFALQTQANSPCPVGAAGHLCRGSVRVSQAAGPEDPELTLPVTLTAKAELTVSGASCFDTGPGQVFCQVPGRGVTDLTVSLTAPTAYHDRTLRLCATLAAPDDPAGQIRLVQTALGLLGFDPGPIDGAAGARTRAAVRQLAQDLELGSFDDARDPRLLEALGLGPFRDAQAGNNQSCAEITLPKTPRPTCKPGTRFEPGIGCVAIPRAAPKPPEAAPASCDPASTVLRNGTCVCRFARMTQVSPTACQCAGGGAPVAGAGCP